MLYQTKANEMKERGDLAGAIANYTKAIEKSPPNTALYYLRGITYATQEDHQRAFEDFAKGLELDPHNESLKVLLKQTAQALNASRVVPFGSL